MVSITLASQGLIQFYEPVRPAIEIIQKPSSIQQVSVQKGTSTGLMPDPMHDINPTSLHATMFPSSQKLRQIWELKNGKHRRGKVSIHNPPVNRRSLGLA